MEQYRLDWISRNQTTIRSDLYTSVRDVVRRGDNDPSHLGKCVILPASFTGCKRYMSQYYKDSLALCRSIGHPTLFLTMTCNLKWPEIKEMMKHLPGVDICDAPDVVARVFKFKVDQLIDLIRKQNFFGRCIGLMHVIEFQKRGLPHVHMLVWLNDSDKPKTAESIDKMVSAEIPDKDKDPVAHAAVSNYMIHGPCGKDNTQSPFEKKGVKLDNRYVVPYNRELLLRFQCHINIEICNNSRSLKYLFKKSKLEAWFIANKEIPTARNYTYHEFPRHFTWLPRVCRWKERQRGDVVGRLSEVHATAGELLYLRMLLMRKKGAINFQDVRTVDNHVYDTFKEACAALGLLENDSQWHHEMFENSHSAMPNQLREMFVNILAYCSVTDPGALWNAHWKSMSEDILGIRRRASNNPELQLSDIDIQHYAIAGYFQ
ncbi:hypothetical protein DCAR_0100936 [Daucus carota subsp. sativus]|uniref:Helitron helicase-like domain-containing protein n=1 Tax=Daucus carota subsp. sativus TaxID=79200 RepID=A0AAF0W1M2_DAUCS|nr:hypothetical protein DCAR_0100936 [Daucus carota subsp. sativus]